MNILNNVSNFCKLLNLSEYLLLQQANIQQTTEENTGQLEQAYQFINSAQENLHEHIESVQVGFILTVRCVMACMKQAQHTLFADSQIRFVPHRHSKHTFWAGEPAQTYRECGSGLHTYSSLYMYKYNKMYKLAYKPN